MSHDEGSATNPGAVPRDTSENSSVAENAPHPGSVDRPASIASDKTPEVAGIIAKPWLRFFARSVDNSIWILILSVATGFVWPEWFEDKAFMTSRVGSYLLAWVLLPFALILDATSYALLGNSLGKWIAGIKVKSLAGEKVSLLTYLKRNFGVYIFGLGTNFPLVTLLTLWSSYGRAEEGGAMRWDADNATRPFVNSMSTVRLVLIGAIWALFFVGNLAVLYLF
jgi:uncharacterized RDD family membrane protein YckC